MKRSTWITVMVLLVASTHLARAQVTVGVSAGFSHTSASVIDEFGIDIETDPLNGLVIGVVAGYEMTPHLGLQIGALYAEGGSIMTPNRTGVPDVDFGVSFLEIPVFMKVAAGGRVSPYLLAGGVVGINTDRVADCGEVQLGTGAGSGGGYHSEGWASPLSGGPIPLRSEQHTAGRNSRDGQRLLRR